MNFNPFDLAEQQYKNTQSMAAENFPEEVGVNISPNLSQPFGGGFSPFDVATHIFDQKDPESWWDATQRNITRTGSRMVETVLGLPGDIQNFGKMILSNVPNAAGLVGVGIEKGLGSDYWKTLVEGVTGTMKFPGQQELQSLSEQSTEGYTSPQGPWEQRSDEVTKTFTNLMTGGGTKALIPGATRLSPSLQSVASFGRKLGMSLAAESAKEGIKLYGGSETQQELGKLASLFTMGLTLPRITGEMNPENYLTSLYKKRDALIPKGTMVTPVGIENSLQNFVNNTLKSGGPTPEKRSVLGFLTGTDGFLTRLQQGALSIEELLDMYRSVNRNRSAVMAAKDLDKAGVKTARRYWGEVANILNQGIEGYLGTINPEALSLHRAANSGWAALNRSNVVSNFVMNHAKNVPLKTGVATLFGGGLFYPQVALPALGAAAMGAAGVSASELAMRFIRNPTLRHYYNQVITSALRENGAETIRALKKLDDRYSKELNDPNSIVNQPLAPYKG